MNNDRDLILAEIKRLHLEKGRTPGIASFEKATGIPNHRILGVHWARWSDAIAEAGLAQNKLTTRYDSNQLLQGLASFARSLGRYPSHDDIKFARRNGVDLAYPDVYSGHFGGAEQTKAALLQFCEKDDNWKDVASFIPRPAEILPEASSSKLGHVYLLQSGEHYKIGRTDNVERRFKEITVAMPAAVTLIHSIVTDDPSGIEAYWHKRFADRRANGEWFKLSRDDVAVFRRRKFQ